MDHAALMVWIDNNAMSERELAGRLCRRHADALVVPRGWTIDDRRDAIPRLFRSLAMEVGADKARSRRPGEHRTPVSRPEAPSLFEVEGREEHSDDDVNPEEAGTEQEVTGVDDPEVAAPEEPAESDPDETHAMPWTPQLTGRYSPDDTGPVSGRLLGRAFGVRRGQE